MQIESISEHLKRRLRDVGPGKFEAIAGCTGVALSFIRKFVYGSRDNPRVQTIQPLIDFFGAVDRGEICIDALAAPAAQAPTAINSEVEAA